MSEALRTKITSSPTPSTLLTLYGRYRKTQTSYNDLVSTLSRKHATSYFQALVKHASWIIEEEKYVPECCFEDADPENTMIVDAEVRRPGVEATANATYRMPTNAYLTTIHSSLRSSPFRSSPPVRRQPPFPRALLRLYNLLRIQERLPVPEVPPRVRKVQQARAPRAPAIRVTPRPPPRALLTGSRGGHQGEGGRGAKDGWSEATAAASNCATMRSSLILHSAITNNLLPVASLLVDPNFHHGVP